MWLLRKPAEWGLETHLGGLNSDTGGSSALNGPLRRVTWSVALHFDRCHVAISHWASLLPRLPVALPNEVWFVLLLLASWRIFVLDFLVVVDDIWGIVGLQRKTRSLNDTTRSTGFVV
ncbi:hypothetical protein JTE90_004297 [Oedothorax gibbosus]|uniref:Uncharacterized protein n=1 Tax=Oedothorax gibbosus TaxID=931172 RepID=A0AAV6VMH7_9ARAC|nr:hypothetical protein JTE90_004297 [Oedothorax gibbosus]